MITLKLISEKSIFILITNSPFFYLDLEIYEKSSILRILRYLFAFSNISISSASQSWIDVVIKHIVNLFRPQGSHQ